MLLVFKQSNHQNNNTTLNQNMKQLCISNPCLSLPPQSMALYWFSSSLVGFSHNLLLRSPAIHKILKLKTQRSEAPYRDLLTAFVSKYCK